MEDIQRLFQYGTKDDLMKGGKKKLRQPDDYNEEDEFLEDIEERIFMTTRNVLIGQGCVFFGAFANRLYLKDLKYRLKQSRTKSSLFDTKEFTENLEKIYIKLVRNL